MWERDRNGGGSSKVSGLKAGRGGFERVPLLVSNESWAGCVLRWWIGRMEAILQSC